MAYKPAPCRLKTFEFAHDSAGVDAFIWPGAKGRNESRVEHVANGEPVECRKANVAHATRSRSDTTTFGSKHIQLYFNSTRRCDALLL